VKRKISILIAHEPYRGDPSLALRMTATGIFYKRTTKKCHPERRLYEPESKDLQERLRNDEESDPVSRML